MSKVIAVVEAHYSRTLFEKFWGLTRVTSDRSDTWCAVCLLSRSSHQRCSRKLAFLRILQNSLETPVLDSPFYKILGLRLASLLKKRLWYRCFPVNFAIYQELLFHRTPSGDRFWWLCGSISCKKYQSPVYSWRKDKEKNKSFQNFS